MIFSAFNADKIQLEVEQREWWKWENEVEKIQILYIENPQQ